MRRYRGQRGEGFDLTGGRGVGPAEEIGYLLQNPSMPGDHVGDVEEHDREGVARPLAVRKGFAFVGAVDDDGGQSAGEQFRVAQRIGHPV